MDEIERIEQDAHHFALTSNPPIHKVEIRLIDFDWLVNRAKDEEKQAKRVQELEKEVIRLHGSRDALTKRLEEKNQRYKQALEFYADEKSYTEKVNDEWGAATAILVDRGSKARKELKGVEG
ncbi:hypothetical protein [Virgibacillus salexigens]|uniref:Uncharacterized protein n=1 Tax=Virgibacillus kapii TaxID=1638645 RepID=A0ABQ2DPX8_9BACI|nr:hypothetical protein [Virgibacillus kapii]GGJ61877.1 hypothetical protein GCM10007111_24950 [Virgibacillus kapii]